MLKSMTGFGRGEAVLNSRRFIAEIKTVNNRHRDLFVRLPRTLQPIEDEVRNQVSAVIRRGRVEVTLQMEKEGVELEYDLQLNLPLVRSYLRVFKQLNEEFGIEGKVRAEDLCQMKDVLLVKPEELDLALAKEACRQALTQALEACDSMRVQEGKTLKEDFVKRLALIEDHLKEVESRAGSVVEDYKRRLKQRVEHMAQGMPVDENRLMQEIAIFADRCDITEELVRARSHLDQFRSYLSPEDAVGRRLDFLLQEINREINT
ncbi:MAG: YicC family protein, partial [Desulfobacterota bacterium]|nr:YicC family protein [Thermodesulfobacteriota bacterium]